MYQVNMYEAKTELSKIVRSLETGEESVVFIARNGKPVVQMTLIGKPENKNRIGTAKGKFKAPEHFDDWDTEIEDMFEGKI